MRATYDKKHGLGYVYLTKRDQRAFRTVHVEDDLNGVVLDFNHHGHLIGIEFLSKKAMPPDLRRIAKPPRSRA